jgi:hypothetical protein
LIEGLSGFRELKVVKKENGAEAGEAAPLFTGGVARVI